MVSLLMIVVIIVVLGLIMEIAATALKLTGLDIHTARFQALSAITGTGFTTKETELIMGHRQRRSIIMTLMILGPICFLGMLSSVLISFGEKFDIKHLIALLLFVGFLLVLTRSKRFVKMFHNQIEKQLKKYKYPRKLQFDELLQLDSDFGIFELKITNTSAFVNKQLIDANFKEKGFIVLAIERAGELLTTPKGSDMILTEDVLVIFGKMKDIKGLHD
ncbi:MAG: TrkA C-terminal domain-containing protein [Candidatus Omnitrophota bacterium]